MSEQDDIKREIGRDEGKLRERDAELERAKKVVTNIEDKRSEINRRISDNHGKMETAIRKEEEERAA